MCLSDQYKQAHQKEAVMCSLWFNPSNGRHYQIDISKDLSGEWDMVREWWGQKRHGGKLKAHFFSLTECLVEFKKIEQLREYRGYKKIG